MFDLHHYIKTDYRVEKILFRNKDYSGLAIYLCPLKHYNKYINK